MRRPSQLSVDSAAESLFPEGSEYLQLDEDGQVRGGSAAGIELFAPVLQSEGMPNLPDGGSADTVIAGQTVTLTRLKAGPQDSALLLFEPETAFHSSAATSIADVRAEEGLAPLESDEDRGGPDASGNTEEPLLPLGLPEAPGADTAAAAGAGDDAPHAEDWVEPFIARQHDSGLPLSSLFDRLAGDTELYTQLTAEDEQFIAPANLENAGETVHPVEEPPQELPAEPEQGHSGEAEPPADSETPDGAEAAVAEEPSVSPPDAPLPPDFAMIGAVIEFADDPEDPELAADAEASAAWRVIGRGFEPLARPQDAPQAEQPDARLPDEPAEVIDTTPDADPADRGSRYNFDELSRILIDRVGSDTPPSEPPIELETPIAPPARPTTQGNEGVININAETFVLNRLPLGILVFRDQNVLFANRALTDLTGHEGLERLRSGGIGSIFPTEDGANAGPVTHLVRRDGALLPVNARLQAITWQGRPALMLCASPAENRFGHEAAVKTFAELLAQDRDDGFIAADRAGIVTRASAPVRMLFNRDDAELVGKPLAAFIAPGNLPAFRDFLERPARFAETSRPSLTVTGTEPGSELTIFAEGQAGIVTGYFGFVRARRVAAAAPPVSADAIDPDVEPSMLARLSRGIRRPLNTIVGFADLIRSSAFGAIENQRYVEYAQDIKTAGHEIALLVDELDDFTRLREGRYAARPADLDLTALLESCVLRVKGQAGTARVLVRSAISERLPRIRADRASLGQAVLNLLASAIDQTPVGGSVILSAQAEDDGGIAVHVRDGSSSSTDMDERFVVFRDGVGRDGEVLMPVRSSVGLALTRSLLAVNSCALSVDPSGGVGTLFSLLIPADLVTDS